MSNNQVDAGAATANAGDVKSSSNQANEATPSNEALDSPIDAHIGSTHEGMASQQETEGAKLAENDDTSEAMKDETGDGQDALISPRETMSDDEVCKERETVNATTADDCEPAVTKDDTVNAKLVGASGSDIPRTETESIDEEIGTVQEEKGACAPPDDQDVQPNVDSSPAIDNSISIEDDNFVAIELVESANNAEETRHTNQEQAALLENDELQTSANPSLDINTNTTSNNTSQATTNQLTNPNSKLGKKLRHPLLTPLTKLPWDKLVNAAGTCDLLFNCKYTQRQVEDEVRQENKTIQYNIHDDEEDVECNVEDLGLHCCSMLEDSDDEGENVAYCKSAQIENQQQQQLESRGDLLVNEEQKVKSWRGSNPTLDMMLYKQFLEE